MTTTFRSRDPSATSPWPLLAVIGAADAPGTLAEAAEAVGRAAAAHGHGVVCGGHGGVMAAACRGARAGGAPTVGLLPGEEADEANPWVDIAVPTGLGEARNALVVRTGVAVVAVGGGWGTLSEIALARKMGRRVVGLATWQPGPPEGTVDEGVEPAASPEEAVARALGGGPIAARG